MSDSSSKQETPALSSTFTVDTTRGSLLHYLAALPGRGQGLPPAAAYLLTVAITYVPLAAVAAIDSLPVLHTTPTLRLPFLYDWNFAFMLLVSFPCLVVLTLTDDRALASSLERVQLDGTVKVASDASISIASRWQARFRRVNIGAQCAGLLIGLLVAYFNYLSYAPKEVGYWISDNDRLLPVGVVFLYCVFLFFACIPIYLLRTIAVTLLLRDLVEHAELRMLPFHPDKSGGLRPVGRLGLRNQYGLTVFGVNIVSLAAISFFYLDVPRPLYGLIIAAALAYLVVGPLAFMGPLLPFRGAMLRTKAELMGEVAERLRVELHRLRAQLPSGPITREDEELIDRLRKLGAVVEELPVWPFDAGTLRKFLAAYVIPVLSALGYPVAAAMGSLLIDRLRQ